LLCLLCSAGCFSIRPVKRDAAQFHAIDRRCDRAEEHRFDEVDDVSDKSFQRASDALVKPRP
jgi:hypothetical protein